MNIYYPLERMNCENLYDRTQKGKKPHQYLKGISDWMIEGGRGIENLQWPHGSNKLNFLDLKASESH